MIFISHTSALLILRNNRNQTYPLIYSSTTDVPKHNDTLYKVDLIDLKNQYSQIINNKLDILVSKKKCYIICRY